MPNFRVFNESASSLLAEVSNPTAGCLLSVVSNSTAGCLLSQVSQTTAGSLLATVNNSTAGCLLSTVNNSTAGCLLSTVNNSTAGCLLSTVNNSTAGCLLSTVNNSTAASLQVNLGDRTTLNTTETVAPGTGASVNGTTRDVLSYSSVTFAAYASGANSGLAKLQISADGTNFEDDVDGTLTITTARTVFFVPATLTRYARLVTGGATTTATIVITAQGHI